MKNKELYSIFIVCLLMMSSCLGDTNTQITVGEQEAVYQTRPTQGFFVEGGRFLYGTNLGVSGNNGDCFLIQYSFDSAAPELQVLRIIAYHETILLVLHNRMGTP